MFSNIGLPEILFILLIVVVLFGATRLPQIGEGIGKAIRNFKKAMSEPEDKNDAKDSKKS